MYLYYISIVLAGSSRVLVQCVVNYIYIYNNYYYFTRTIVPTYYDYIYL